MAAFRARLSYHVSHEQFAPSALLRLVVAAEKAGFDAAFSSDHFNPWSRTQGHAGFSWSWLGAAMQATRHLRFSTITVPGGWRYRPAVLAQAVATLAEMFPSRLPWVALGTGQALSERVGGSPWPDLDTRRLRLRAAADVMRRLLDGEHVRNVREYAVDARVWSRPRRPPRLVIAATTPQTAAWAAPWAAGLLTVGADLDRVGEIARAFRSHGGDGKPMHLKVDLCRAQREEEALEQAHAHWRFNALGSEINTTLSRPEEFEAATAHLRPADLRTHVLPACDPGRVAAHLRACEALGFETLDLHHVGPDQAGFIEWFADHLRPLL